MVDFLVKFLVVGFAVLGVVYMLLSRYYISVTTPEQRLRDVQAQQHGHLNPKIVCPQCQTAGMVRLQSRTVKAGISGGKATAGILTGGASLLVTGLSSKTAVTV